MDDQLHTESINNRNRLYKNRKQFKPEFELKKTITHAKTSHYKDLFKKFKFDMKKTWAV